jgi:hypothetical protein
MSMPDPFSNPQSGFDKVQDYAEFAMIITPRDYLTGLTTQHSKSPGDTDAVEADVVILYPDGTVKEIPLARIFPGGLIGQLRRSMGQMVIGRLGKQDTPKGQAWVLNQATEGDRALGVAYLQAKAQGKLKTPAPTATAPTATAQPAMAVAGTAPKVDPFA